MSNNLRSCLLALDLCFLEKMGVGLNAKHLYIAFLLAEIPVESSIVRGVTQSLTSNSKPYSLGGFFASFELLISLRNVP